MSEYTSLDVSTRLLRAGFVDDSDDLYAGIGMPAYRADTLLVWLLEKGVGVYIDKKNGVDYVYPYGADAKSVTAPALPDALGEVILQVVAKEIPYSKHLRDSVTDIINGEDIDPTPD